LTEIEVNVGVNFNQQERSKSSVPDGVINRKVLKLLSKLSSQDGSLTSNQLRNHLDSFERETTQILLALGPVRVKQMLLQCLH